MGEKKNAYNILVGKSKGARPHENLGIDVRIIQELILGKYGGDVWLDSSGPGKGTSVGLL
jgi:hypothetical protein